MAFMVYKRTEGSDVNLYRNLGTPFSLAGYNLVYDIWEKRARPINIGWTITRKDLVEAFQPDMTEELAFLIDFDPQSTSRIGIIEVDRIHVYTYGNRRTKTAYWSPMMIEFSTLVDDEDFENLGPKEKRKFLSLLKIKKEDMLPSVEFLYLHGTELSWNWGKNGMTNAAFIGAEARTYFRNFF